MDNITRQNQFYETPVIKQENESGYDRRPLDMEPQQQAYRPGRKEGSHTFFLEGNRIQVRPCVFLFWPLSFWQGFIWVVILVLFCLELRVLFLVWFIFEIPSLLGCSSYLKLQKELGLSLYSWSFCLHFSLSSLWF